MPNKPKPFGKPKNKATNRVTKIPKPITPGPTRKPAPLTKPKDPNYKIPNTTKRVPIRKPKGPDLSGFLTGIIPKKTNKPTPYRKGK
jgi:hypothetical protein